MHRFIIVAALLLVSALPASAQDSDSPFGGTAGYFFATNLTGQCEQIASLDVNGIVQLDEDKCTTVLPMLQTHLLFPIRGSGTFSWGPAIGVALGEGIIEQVGLSFAFGISTGGDSGRRIVIGVGLWAQPGADMLRPAFAIGQPSPVGPDGASIEPSSFVATNVRTAITASFELF